MMFPGLLAGSTLEERKSPPAPGPAPLMALFNATPSARTGMGPDFSMGTPPPPKSDPKEDEDKRPFLQRVQDFFKDEEKVAKFIMALEPLRGYGARPGAASGFAEAVLKEGRARREAGRETQQFLDFLVQKGQLSPAQVAQLEGSPRLAQAMVEAYLTRQAQGNFEVVTGADLGLSGSQSNAPFSRNTVTGEARPLSGSGITINQGGTVPPGYRPTFDEQGTQTGVEPIPGGPEDPNADQEENAQKFAAYQAGLDGLMESFNLAQTGNLLGLLPAMTPGDVAFEGVRDAMLQPLKSIFRGKGEGTFTDADAEQLLRMLPTKRDNADTAKMKLFTTENIIRARLGMPLLEMPTTRSIVDEARELTQGAGSN